MGGHRIAVEYRQIAKADTPGIAALCAAEGWTSYTRDSELTWRILIAPGATTWVAVDSGRVVGFIVMQSDGRLQAHISLILVAADHRRQGIGTKLVQEAFRQCGAERIDVVTERAPEFYRSFAHHEWHGFRIHPQYSKDGTPNNGRPRLGGIVGKSEAPSDDEADSQG